MLLALPWYAQKNDHLKKVSRQNNEITGLRRFDCRFPVYDILSFLFIKQRVWRKSIIASPLRYTLHTLKNYLLINKHPTLKPVYKAIIHALDEHPP